MLNNVIKFSVGRLRPHFLDVCKPDIDVSHYLITTPREDYYNVNTVKYCFQFTDETICGTILDPEYVTNFTCAGNSALFPDESEREARIREARLSFLSGHASLSW